jgi:hypothetical protein
MVSNIDFIQIKALRDEINRLLEERPEYQALQDEIDKTLAKCGNISRHNTPKENDRITHNRCVVVQDMMLTKWKTIMPDLEDLGRKVKEIGDIAQEGLEEYEKWKKE